MSRLWMVAYDIEDDARRRRVYKVLRDYGARVQYSVFECRLSGAQWALLRERLAAELDGSDSVRWYPLCAWCGETVAVQGAGKPPDDAEFYLP